MISTILFDAASRSDAKKYFDNGTRYELSSLHEGDDNEWVNEAKYKPVKKPVQKKRVRGSIEWDSDNYLAFLTSDGESCSVDWRTTPEAMAKQFRKAADWLDAHAKSLIRANID